MISARSLKAVVIRHGITFMMGLASGLPLLLTGSVMQAWMTDAGVSLDAVGVLALVGIPYTLKFLWAPLLDRLPPPLMGRRRGWLSLIQFVLALLIMLLSMFDPGHLPLAVGVMALLVSFFSASQDIVIDAYRREHLPERELGLGSSFYVYGYRIGTLIASGAGLMLADQVGFQTTYLIMGLLLGGCILITLLAPEPTAAQPDTSLDWRNTFLEPIRNFLDRSGAWWLLLFILLYKLGDSVATNLTIPFYKEIGFSNTEIGTTVKLFGVWMIMAGTMLGGALIVRLGIYRSLWWFGLLQMVSTAGFIWLNHVGHSLTALAAVVSFENLAAGMGTAAFVAFMAALTDKRFTAGQYALLSSIMGLPRVIIASPSGVLADAVGWDLFFLICTLAALPGLAMLWRFREWRDQLEAGRQHDQPAEAIE